MKGKQINWEGKCVVVDNPLLNVATFVSCWLTERSEACTPPFQRALGVVLKLNFNRAVYVKVIKTDFLL